MNGFDLDFSTGLLSQLVGALPITLGMSGLALLLSLSLGLVLALTQVFKLPVFRQLTDLYISFFRGTPLLVQLFLLYYGLPQIFPSLTAMTAFQAATLGLGFHFAAYMAETIRAAILGIDKSQMEAALSIGMDRLTAMKRIVLPQASRIAIPGLMNSFIDLLKSTSLAFTLGVAEIMARTQLEAASSFRFLESYLVLALVYWVLVVMMTWLQKYAEKRLGAAY
ncbi:amino acid ABC transporter permease [Pelagibaculum spongiae]|uniref:ABC transporter permease n=1 Tax=Pelagibaculum spongiae TaxID=2080658 RepID=A0A2V1GVG8_9GAMM|nr:amino acid ABC transporter permease [Pelagibaculum spongiae]PVZ70328.1 ABC transporter permease [Pelagibaculum spongiae]